MDQSDAVRGDKALFRERFHSLQHGLGVIADAGLVMREAARGDEHRALARFAVAIGQDSGMKVMGALQSAVTVDLRIRKVNDSAACSRRPLVAHPRLASCEHEDLGSSKG
jgi:hypothetical protein